MSIANTQYAVSSFRPDAPGSTAPTPVTPLANQIPDELKTRAQWVVWRYELRKSSKGHKWTKPPINARTGGYADSTKPETWATFEEAWRAYETGHYAGVGYVFAPNDPYAGLDFDHCLAVNAAGQMELTPEVAEWINRLDSYTEVSPSGEGLKAICKARPNHNGKNSTSGVEIYDRDRYFTITGKSYHAEGKPIAERQNVADAFTAHYFPPAPVKKKRQFPAEPTPSKPVSHQQAAGPDIEARLEKAFSAKNGDKISQLFAGDCSRYANNHSDADLALASLLAFYCSDDPAVLDAMFRRSYLMREKWDERHASDGRTYGQMTIDKALASATEFYQWNRQSGEAAIEAEIGPFDISSFNQAIRTKTAIARIHEATTAVLTGWGGYGFSASARGLASAIIGEATRAGLREDGQFALPLATLGCRLFKVDHRLKGETLKKRIRAVKDQTSRLVKQFLAEQEKLKGGTFLQYQEGEIRTLPDGKKEHVPSKFRLPGLVVIQETIRTFPQFQRKRSGMKRAAQQALEAYQRQPQIVAKLSNRHEPDKRKTYLKQTLAFAHKYAEEFPNKANAYHHLAEIIAQLGGRESCDNLDPLSSATEPVPLRLVPPALPLPLVGLMEGGQGVEENDEMHDSSLFCEVA